MFERIVDYFYQRGRLRGAGQFLTYATAYSCMFGAAGHFITAVPAALQRHTAQTLAEVLPDVPTWWVPEYLMSVVFVIALSVLGFFLSLKGKQLDRYMSA